MWIQFASHSHLVFSNSEPSGSSACSVLRSFHLMLRRNLWKKRFELLKNNIAILTHCCEWTECTDEERSTNPAMMRRKTCIHFFLQCGNRFREEDTGVCAKWVLQVEVRRALTALCSVTSSQHFLWVQYSLIQPRPSSVEPAVQRES